VVKDGDRRVVFQVDGETVERRAVRVGRELGGDIEILAGLSPGDIVVVEAPADLRDGQKIKIEN
jgi:multidrug efflux pump subunit AcrA (membrane-fusion protein)